MKVWIYGAGAVGCFYGARLIDAGAEVRFISRGAQLEALRAGGLKLIDKVKNTERIYKDFKVTEQSELGELERPDCILICTKRYSNPEVIESLKSHGLTNIPLFIMQNGIISEQDYYQDWPRELVSRVVVYIAVTAIEPGVLEYLGGANLQLEGNQAISKQLLELFKTTDIKVGIPDNLQRIVWLKAIWNTAYNNLTTILQKNVGEILNVSEGRELVEDIMQDIAGVAVHYGQEITSEDIDGMIEKTIRLFPEMYSSTYHDHKRGKKIEVNAIIGDVLELAEAKGIELPRIKSIEVMLKVLSA